MQDSTDSLTQQSSNDSDLAYAADDATRGAGLYVAGICISLVSIILTSAVLYLLSRSSGCKRAYIILIVNLSVSDLLVAVATVGMLASDYAQISIDAGKYGESPEPHRRNDCVRFLFGQVWDVATYENLITLWLMAADHFVAIRYPLRHVVVMKKTYLRTIICSTWVVCSIIGCLPIMFVANSYSPIMDSWEQKGTTRFCYQKVVYAHPETVIPSRDLHSQIIQGVAFAVVSMVFASIVITYAYILAVVLKIRLNHGLAAPKSALSSNTAALLEKRKAILTTLALIGAFCVCYVPIGVYYITQDTGIMAADKGPKGYANICFTSLVSCVGIFDPIIYTARTPEVKSTMREILCFKNNSTEDVSPPAGLRRGTVSTVV